MRGVEGVVDLECHERAGLELALHPYEGEGGVVDVKGHMSGDKAVLFHGDLAGPPAGVLLQEFLLPGLDLADQHTQVTLVNEVVHEVLAGLGHEGVLHLRAPGEVVEVIDEVGVHGSVLLLFRDGEEALDEGVCHSHRLVGDLRWGEVRRCGVLHHVERHALGEGDALLGEETGHVFGLLLGCHGLRLREPLDVFNVAHIGCFFGVGALGSGRGPGAGFGGFIISLVRCKVT